MLRESFLLKRMAMLVLLVLGVLLGSAWAQTESVLYSFCAQSDNCTDGANPYAEVVLDQKGNLYGTTVCGGLNGDCSNCFGPCGVVFKLTPEGKETVLYSFCIQTNCADGEEPAAGLIFDREGNLYGTTEYGGANNDGVVFKLTPRGKYTVLHSFCARDNCRDGMSPQVGLVLDQQENLYGTTQYGGAYGGGVVFKVTPEGKETVLYSFCAQGPPCTDGANPLARLVFDQEGSLFGTTYRGGDPSGCGGYGCGVVFKLTPEGKETVLHSFCTQANCPDGAQPSAGLVSDRKGNLYGTTSGGGAYQSGVVFKLTPKRKETVLYGFCAQSNCADGALPLAGPVFDQRGNLYGTTPYGGAHGAGVVFKLTPKGKETVLYSLCEQGGCTDGYQPFAGVVFDQKGNLYGTTQYGGFSNYPYDCYKGCGVVFKLTP
jgi:uncharacterized repeat protein (TIGR03803 family)